VRRRKATGYLRRMADVPPSGYQAPVLVYSVEFYDARDSAFFQIGAFYSEAEAQALLDQWVAEGGMDDQIRINMLPVHQRLKDWNFDR
jgi:hypothetical protein